MKTYYQKHQTIQATQFDGNWTTLLNNVSTQFRTDFLTETTEYKNTFYQWHREHGKIKWFKLRNNLGIDWQPQYVKRKYRNYRKYRQFQQRVAKLKQQHPGRKGLLQLTQIRTRQETYKYQMCHRVLHQGDYLVLKWVYVPCRDADKSNHHIYDLSRYQIQVWPQAEFESQWSETPIRR